MKLAKAKRVHVQTTWSLLKLYNMLEFEKALLRQGLFLFTIDELFVPVGASGVLGDCFIFDFQFPIAD